MEWISECQDKTLACAATANSTLPLSQDLNRFMGESNTTERGLHQMPLFNCVTLMHEEEWAHVRTSTANSNCNRSTQAVMSSPSAMHRDTRSAASLRLEPE